MLMEGSATNARRRRLFLVIKSPCSSQLLSGSIGKCFCLLFETCSIIKRSCVEHGKYMKNRRHCSCFRGKNNNNSRFQDRRLAYLTGNKRASMYSPHLNKKALRQSANRADNPSWFGCISIYPRFIVQNFDAFARLCHYIYTQFLCLFHRLFINAKSGSGKIYAFFGFGRV